MAPTRKSSSDFTMSRSLPPTRENAGHFIRADKSNPPKSIKMKYTVSPRWNSSLQVMIAIVVAAGALPSVAIAQRDQTVGERFGSREPTTCADTKAPASGPITADLARKYFICQMEKISGNQLNLVEDVKVEVGGGIPYAAIMGHRSLPEIDVNHPVYPIRGSYVAYKVSDPVTAAADHPGRNASSNLHPNATGYCYKTTFGDWRCYMADPAFTNRENTRYNVPPPGARAVAALPGARAGGGGPVEAGPRTAAPVMNDAGAKNEDGFVKPDLTEMEKYFEVVRNEYNPVDGRWIFIVKAKKPTNIFKWYLTAYDADGVKVSDTSFNGNVVSPAIGEPTKIYSFAPVGANMKQVVKIGIALRAD